MIQGSIYRDFVVVRVNSYLKPEKLSKEKGDGGKSKLYIDPFHEMAHHTRVYGEVVYTPMKLGAYPMFEEYIGAPDYSDYSPIKFIGMDKIHLDVKPGDRIYFHYNCMKPRSPWEPFNKNHLMTTKEVGPDGEDTLFYYYKIKYSTIYAAVRYNPLGKSPSFTWNKEGEIREMSGITYSDKDGNLYEKEVVMIGSYVFIEPDKETWEDILRPVPMVVNGIPMVDEFGNPKMLPKDQWISMKAAPEEKSLQGTIRYIGKPLINEDRFFEPGDYVHFKNHADTKIDFEGKELYRLVQRNIYCKEVR